MRKTTHDMRRNGTHKNPPPEKCTMSLSASAQVVRVSVSLTALNPKSHMNYHININAKRPREAWYVRQYNRDEDINYK